MTNDKSVDDYLTKEDCVEIGNKINRANKGDMLKYTKAGAKMNLDLVTDNDNLIKEIYSYIVYKVQKNTKNNNIK